MYLARYIPMVLLLTACSPFPDLGKLPPEFGMGDTGLSDLTEDMPTTKDMPDMVVEDLTDTDVRDMQPMDMRNLDIITMDTGTDMMDMDMDVLEMSVDDIPDIPDLPPTPLELMATNTPLHVELTWKEIMGADTYELQINGGMWMPVMGTSYQDTEAPSPTITSSQTIASYGTIREHVELTHQTRTKDGTKRTYRLRAKKEGNIIQESNLVQGFRLPGAITSLRWEYFNTTNMGWVPYGDGNNIDPYHATNPNDDGRSVRFRCQVMYASGISTTCNEVEGRKRAVLKVAAADTHTCALMSSGGLLCWGAPGSGHLGTGNLMPQTTPPTTELDFGARVIDVVAGTRNTCVLTEMDRVHCMGEQEFGALGGGMSLSDVTSPRIWFLTFPAGKKPVALYGSGEHFCAKLDDDALACWGYNADGQVGINSRTNKFEPAEVLQGVKYAAASRAHTCAVNMQDKLECWGTNAQWQLGYDTGLMVGFLLEPSGFYLKTDINSSDFITRTTDTSLVNTCTVTTANEVYCWGEGLQGQLGNGTTNAAAEQPAAVLTPPANIEQIALAEHAACVLTQNGAVHCWGNAEYGVMGTGNKTDVLQPSSMPLNLGGQVAALDGGQHHFCAVFKNGELTCWGRNDQGQLGNANTSQNIGDDMGEMPPPIIPLW